MAIGYLHGMMGNEIPDDDKTIKQDLARGFKIVYYKEVKEDKKEGRRIVKKTR